MQVLIQIYPHIKDTIGKDSRFTYQKSRLSYAYSDLNAPY